MKRLFAYLIMASLLMMAVSCQSSGYKTVLHVDLKGAEGKIDGRYVKIDEAYLNMAYDRKGEGANWLLGLWIPNTRQEMFSSTDRAEVINHSYKFSKGSSDGPDGDSYLIVDAGTNEYKTLWISGEVKGAGGYTFEFRLPDADEKNIKKIISVFSKYIFTHGDYYDDFAMDPLSAPVDSIATEEVPEYEYRSPKAEDNNMEESSPVHQEDRELYIGPYTASNSGIVRKFTIYEKWMLEHFKPDVNPKKYCYKGTATYEGESYRYYEHNEDTYILVSPDTDNLVMFWPFTFDGKVSHNIDRYKKGDNSSPSSAPPVDMGNSYQQQQYYQQQQKQQRAQMYLSQYRTWENTVVSNYNTLMTMREGAARTSVRMNFRNAQSQMRQIRQNAQMEGISLSASAWESASVPLGYE